MCQSRIVLSVRAILGIILLASPAYPQAANFFITGSDPQFGMYAKDKNFLQETANFEFFVASVNRLKPAFVVLTGDLINLTHDPAQIAEFHRIAAKLDKSIPLYNVPGNHDVGNEPTPADIEKYKRDFGPDHYSFLADKIYGIVVDSSVLAHSKNCPAEAAAQEAWLRAELKKAQADSSRQIVLFTHIPLFVAAGNEDDQYFNFPKAEREKYLKLFRESHVRYIFSGHTHHNYDPHDGDLEQVITSAIGLYLGPDPSGFRIVDVNGPLLQHRFYTLAEIPNQYPPVK